MQNMQAAGDQQFINLKEKFTQLDEDHDGFINKSQLQAFMKSEKLFQVPIWKVNQAMILLSQKMNSDDFAIWIMGCKMGLQDWAQQKFRFANKIKNLSSAGPSAGPSASSGLKKSYLDISVNKEQQSIVSPFSHFFNVKVGIDKEADTKKRQQINQVLGRDPSQIYLLLKFKTIAQGQKIAQNLTQLLEMAVALGSELGPTVVPLIQSLTITTKWFNDYTYVIIELNNSFMNILVKYLNEAIQQLAPQGKFLFETKISSDFSKILQNNFNPLSQPIGLNAELEIGSISLTKLKEKLLIAGFEKLPSSEVQTIVFMFLLQQVNLALSFSSLKECFESFGLNEDNIPKPGIMAGQLKNYEIKQIISQFVPEGQQLLNIISNNCKPEGQISFNVSNIAAELSFNFNVQGAFQLL